MSGGEKKKKTSSSRTQGWEEAGSEFYQESYPVDTEIEVLWKDPKRLATLLPSKQTRAVVSTVRLKTNDTRTYKSTVRRLTGGTRSRCDSTSTTFNRRPSLAGGDVQVSMLPDLSEMRSNEQTAWEEVMGIKALPLSMARKKEEKTKIMSEQHLRLQGFEQLKWKKRKIWHKYKARLLEMYYKIELWRKHLKHIESNFGTGVVTFFCFIKWLFFLNFLIAILIILFLILPTVLIDNKKQECLNSSNDTCRYLCTTDSNNTNIFLDIVQGTGRLEKTILFHGYYSSEILTYSNSYYYNMPLAFLLVAIAYFLLSLMAILRTAAKGFKDRLVEGEGQFYKYSNLVFGGWDFCIHNEKSAKFKHQAIYNEIKMLLQSERLEEERQNRTRQEKCKLFVFRLLINILVMAILFFCAGVIYNVFNFSENVPVVLKDSVPQVIFEFLPSLTIVILNMLIPLIFRFIISYEHYSPIFTIKMMLFRTIFLRLASLIVFYASIYSKIQHEFNSDEGDGGDLCPCWETFVGQQIYKLILTDFFMHLVMTCNVNFLRALIARHVQNKFIKLIGEQTFDLPRHVLDIIYIQTLCWFGIFFAPLISIMATVIFFILFYIKKFACLINCKPSTTIYRPSRSNSMFMSVLLISYMVAIIPIAFTVAELKPSQSCGPFQQLPSIWYYMEQLFMEMPMWIQSIAAFITTAPFAIPVIIILFLLLYYYMAVNSANKHMVTVLKNQLVLEGHDKKFLIDRLYMFIKQENEKRARLANSRLNSGEDTTIRS